MQNSLYRLTNLSLVLACSCLLWLIPASHNICVHIDHSVATWLNQTLSFSRGWQLLWACLNHRHETWLNVVFMVGINLAAIFSLPKEKRATITAAVAYFWIFFQIVLLCTHKIFFDWLNIHRQSPSLLITPWLSLAELVNMDNIKVYSYSCFPAGHVLVLVFWRQFTNLLFQQKWVKVLTTATLILLTLPRLISGAHWLSDVIFTTIYGLLWFDLAVNNLLFTKVKTIGTT